MQCVTNHSERAHLWESFLSGNFSPLIYAEQIEIYLKQLIPYLQKIEMYDNMIIIWHETSG
jgi:hypothetical protein